jgi:hypothetical protein
MATTTQRLRCWEYSKIRRKRSKPSMICGKLGTQTIRLALFRTIAMAWRKSAMEKVEQKQKKGQLPVWQRVQASARYGASAFWLA